MNVTSIPPLDHERFMRAAIACAGNAVALPFGAVIVSIDDAAIVAEGCNRSHVSPTFHGEIDVINRCAEAHPGIDWTGLALYTTAEPCPMCQAAIAWAGIRLVVYGSSIPFLKSLGCPQLDIRAEEIANKTPFRSCSIVSGVLEDDCNALFRAVTNWPVVNR